MPEPPDFDQLALQLVTQNTAKAQVAIAEQLRLVWNARGAADITKAEATLGELGMITSELSISMIDRALRTLDR